VHVRHLTGNAEPSRETAGKAARRFMPKGDQRMRDFAGRAAFVTGGGSGIGAAVAEALADEGVAVAVADIAAERAAGTVEAIKGKGGSAIALTCDVSDRASVMAARDAAVAAFGAVSIMMANAGITSFERVVDMPSHDLDWIYGVNFLGVSHCLEAFLPGMMAGGGGHVVATSSMAGLLPEWLPVHAPYVATKAGVIGMMLNLRAELGAVSVGSTVLCPGGVATRITESPSVRPDRFGGPMNVEVPKQEGAIADNNIVFRPPHEVAKMVMHAIREDRAMIITDGKRRELFMDTYVQTVMQAFDDAEQFDRENGG
jgi:NAD(P)-dependent dehydrogenase (short-subunit alcohol dehydrogenase family)